jgi:hypothetical protein
MREVCAVSGADPRTVRKVLKGKRVRGEAARRIAAALDLVLERAQPASGQESGEP